MNNTVSSKARWRVLWLALILWLLGSTASVVAAGSESEFKSAYATAEAAAFRNYFVKKFPDVKL